MNTLSVVIICFNEAKKIARCLDSVKDIADEIIVVDSQSTDDTEAICRSYDLTFVTQPWLGYAEQKNFADGLAKGHLIFSIDADEALSERLKASIKQLKEAEIADNQVFSMNRLNNYCGKWIKRCGFYPDNKIRIWKRGFARWEGRIHEWLEFKSDAQTSLLEGDLLHYSYDTPEAYRQQLFHFAELGAQSYYERQKKTGCIHWLFNPAITFIRTYFIKEGFLEGKDGFYICRTAMQANRHKFNLLRAKIRDKR
ncbi:MAG: glycosyltransferase family 2 protein [Bacteroidales bacterium]|nr:glycosyltransferase family 2 protein [Bacteroidales bacterium]